METDLPPIPKELIDALDQKFPERSPELTWSLDRIRHEGGQRAVVRFLIEQYRLQQENVLNPQVL